MGGVLPNMGTVADSERRRHGHVADREEAEEEAPSEG